MVAESIDKLKREYTDKYVVVDPSRPELARFRDITGQVKTVNMSGRALVEFLDYHLNIGWYDIDPAFLRVVDKPIPKVEKPKAEKKPAAKVEAKPPAEGKAPPAKTQAAAKPQAAGKMSVAEMLAAARGGKGGAPAAPAPTKPAGVKPKAETTPKTEVAKPQAAKPASGGKMSVAEMLAAARASAGGKAEVTPAAKADAKPQAAVEPEGEVEAVEAAAAPATGADVSARHKVDRTKMSVAEMIAYARQSDGKG